MNDQERELYNKQYDSIMSDAMKRLAEGVNRQQQYHSMDQNTGPFGYSSLFFNELLSKLPNVIQALQSGGILITSAGIVNLRDESSINIGRMMLDTLQTRLKEKQIQPQFPLNMMPPMFDTNKNHWPDYEQLEIEKQKILQEEMKNDIKNQVKKKDLKIIEDYLAKKQIYPTKQEKEEFARLNNLEIPDLKKFENDEQLLRWILDRISYLQKQKKQDFIDMYNADKETLSTNSGALYQLMFGMLGKHAADIVYDRFNVMRKKLH